jgi:type II secretion system protein G
MSQVFMQAKVKTITSALLLLAATSAQAYIAIHLATESTIKQLDGCLHTFGLVQGRFPSLNEGLPALVTAPADIRNTNMFPYIKAIPKDPWGRDYVYRFPALHNAEGPDVYSLGEDGISKTGGNDRDDINNWNKGRPWASYYNRQPLLYRLLSWLIPCGIVAAFVFVLCQNRKQNGQVTAGIS